MSHWKRFFYIIKKISYAALQRQLKFEQKKDTGQNWLHNIVIS